MSDWMTPEERRFFTGRDHSVSLGADYVRLLDITAKADARIRELEAQVKTAEELPLAEFGDILGHNYWLDANTLQALWKRMREASARALSRNDVPALRAEIERLQLQLAACGVAAQCNTTESAAKNRIDKRNIYWSVSYSDVCSAVDREMLLREKLASVTKAAKDLIAEIGKYGTRQPLCDTNIHWFKRLLREACE